MDLSIFYNCINKIINSSNQICIIKNIDWGIDIYNKLLNENKNKIDKYYDSNLWDKTKKIVNPYELVYITNKKTRYKSVSTFEPLSRSFYKCIKDNVFYRCM